MTPDFTTTILVDQTQEEAFNAINNVRGWWSEEIEGSTDKLDDEFNYHFEDVHRCKIKLTEVVQIKKWFGLCWTTILNSRKTKANGQAQKLFLTYQRKIIKRKSALRTWAWFLHMNALRFAEMHGAIIYKIVCAA